MSLSTIEEALTALREGKPVLVADAENREALLLDVGVLGTRAPQEPGQLAQERRQARRWSRRDDPAVGGAVW